jgi:hypothetical protein
MVACATARVFVRLERPCILRTTRKRNNDMREDIVSCKVGCAEDDNAFYPVATTPDPASTFPSTSAPVGPKGTECNKCYRKAGDSVTKGWIS